MKTILLRLAWLPLLAGQLAWAQAAPPPPASSAPAAPPVEDFKPSTLNQSGQQYPMVNSERRARFRIVAPQAQNVRVDLGGGTNLTKDDSGTWVGTTRPLDEGFHYYQVTVDGLALSDPGTQYFYGASRWGSGIEVPAADQDFYALKNVPHGQLRSIHFFSKSANIVQHCFVYTPPDYDKNLSPRYPVLYLQHGGGEDENSWGAQGHAGLIMDNLIADGKAKPFLIVMANSNVNGTAAPAGRGGAPGTAPSRGPAAPGAMGPDLDGQWFFVGAPAGQGSAPGAAGRGAGPGRGAFNAGTFQTILLEELIPFIDQNYRTVADAPHRAMAGLSMGGIYTKQITMAHLDTFSHIGLLSGGSIATTEVSDMATFKQKVKLVFVSYGSRENGAASKTVVEGLQQAGIKSVFYESPNTAHEWLTWRRSLYQIAPLLFQN